MKEDWYELDWGKIHPRTVIKRTEHYVYILGDVDFRKKQRKRKFDPVSWFQTWDEAKAALIARIERAIQNHKDQVVKGEEALTKARELKP